MNKKSKSIAIITSGSRGDVQPFVALALGLQKKGHRVVLATHEEFRAWVESYGLTFKTLAGDPKALISSEEGQQFLTSRNPFKFLLGAKRLNTKAAEMLHEQMRTGLTAAEGAEALICSFSAPLAFFVSEKLRIPSICVALAPISRTSSFPPIILSPKNFGPKLNRMCHRVFELVVDLLLRKNIKMIRAEHDLTPLPLGRLFSRFYDPDALLLNAFSSKVVCPTEDWPMTHPLTGYWTIPQPTGYQPPSDLNAFLEAGEPPIYVGFGSMVDNSPTELTDLVISAARKSKRRILISKGWANLASSTSLPDFVLAIDNVPHEWLFPRLKGIVHHGGAGTTAAALRAGVPSTIVPFGVDQPFWAWRVAKIGVGCVPIPRKKLTGDNLAEAFTRMSNDETMKRLAFKLGEELRGEDGVAKGIDYIENFIEKSSFKS